MTTLRIFNETNPHRAEQSCTDPHAIRRELEAIGVLYERWDASRQVDAEASQDEIIEAYRSQLDQLMQRFGFRAVDVIALNADHPQKEALRDKFLHEHTHDDFEARFFVEGQGLFYLRVDGKVYAVLCTAGDLLSVPAGTTHWFDMGPEPHLKAIRLFTTPEGWVANFTGDNIADRFPRLDTIHAAA